VTETSHVVLGFGKANFPDTLASYTCQKVEAPFVRVSAVTSGKALSGGHEYLPGSIPHRGTIWVRPVEHPEGTLILLQASWKRSGAPIRDGAVFLKLRNQGAQWEVNFRLPTDACNVVGDSVRAFEGRADILGEQELASIGIEVPRMFRDKFMTDEEVDECFTIVRVSAEIAPRPQRILVGEGRDAKVVELAAAPLRRMAFRRPKG
jgi:hypothetical protein